MGNPRMIVYKCNHCHEFMHEGAYLTLTPRAGIQMHFCSWRCVEVMAANNGI
jgi:hypothetical protein